MILVQIYIFFLLLNALTCEEKIFDNENCGYVQSESWPAISPWLASIQAVNLQSGLVFIICGGTLINHKYVVTSADCITNDELLIDRVQLGMTFFRNYTIYSPIASGVLKVTYIIKEKIIHPLYKPKLVENNIALLRLDRFVDYTEYVQPICLPFITRISAIGTKLYTSSWTEFIALFASFPQGKTNIPSMIITNQENKNIIHSIDWENATTKVCEAFPGVPLTFIKNGQSSLLGILIQKSNCNSNRPHTYLNIFNYLNWINENVHSNYDRCSTPDNETSSCIPISQCPILLRAFANPKKKYENYLSKYICSNDKVDGFQVCCPKTLNSIEVQADSTTLNRLSDKRFCGYQHRDDYFSENATIALDEFPWLATFRAVGTNNSEFSVCSGSLINNRYVLTSAYCVLYYNEIVSVRLGEYDSLNKTDCVTLSQINIEDCSEFEDFGIDEVIVHPFYNFWSFNYDIALIRLNRRVTYTDYIRPICLPIPTLFTPARPSDEFYTTSFTSPKPWGTDYLKKKLYYTLLQNEQCQEKQLLTDYQMCLLPKAMPTDRFFSCYNDEGALAMIAHRNQWTLEGITTEKKSFCNPLKPIILSKISAYLPWIQENTKN